MSALWHKMWYIKQDYPDQIIYVEDEGIPCH